MCAEILVDSNGGVLVCSGTKWSYLEYDKTTNKLQLSVQDCGLVGTCVAQSLILDDDTGELVLHATFHHNDTFTVCSWSGQKLTPLWSVSCVHTLVDGGSVLSEGPVLHLITSARVLSFARGALVRDLEFDFICNSVAYTGFLPTECACALGRHVLLRCSAGRGAQVSVDVFDDDAWNVSQEEWGWKIFCVEGSVSDTSLVPASYADGALSMAVVVTEDAAFVEGQWMPRIEVFVAARLSLMEEVHLLRVDGGDVEDICILPCPPQSMWAGVVGRMRQVIVVQCDDRSLILDEKGTVSQEITEGYHRVCIGDWAGSATTQLLFLKRLARCDGEVRFVLTDLVDSVVNGIPQEEERKDADSNLSAMVVCLGKRLHRGKESLRRAEQQLEEKTELELHASRLLVDMTTSLRTDESSDVRCCAEGLFPVFSAQRPVATAGGRPFCTGGDTAGSPGGRSSVVLHELVWSTEEESWLAFVVLKNTSTEVMASCHLFVVCNQGELVRGRSSVVSVLPGERAGLHVEALLPLASGQPVPLTLVAAWTSKDVDQTDVLSRLTLAGCTERGRSSVPFHVMRAPGFLVPPHASTVDLALFASTGVDLLQLNLAVTVQASVQHMVVDAEHCPDDSFRLILSLRPHGSVDVGADLASLRVEVALTVSRSSGELSVRAVRRAALMLVLTRVLSLLPDGVTVEHNAASHRNLSRLHRMVDAASEEACCAVQVAQSGPARAVGPWDAAWRTMAAAEAVQELKSQASSYPAP